MIVACVSAVVIVACVSVVMIVARVSVVVIVAIEKADFQIPKWLIYTSI